MKRIGILILVVIISLLFISCSDVHANSKFNTGLVILPIEQDNYEWQYIKSDNSIRIKEIDLPLFTTTSIYEIEPTRNGIFRVVFNCINLDTNQIEYIASYNMEVDKNKIHTISEDLKQYIGEEYKNKKPLHMEIIGEKNEY